MAQIEAVGRAAKKLKDSSLEQPADAAKGCAGQNEPRGSQADELRNEECQPPILQVERLNRYCCAVQGERHKQPEDLGGAAERSQPGLNAAEVLGAHGTEHE